MRLKTCIQHSVYDAINIRASSILYIDLRPWMLVRAEIARRVWHRVRNNAVDHSFEKINE